jgi:integrase
MRLSFDTAYSMPDDWVFPSERKFGTMPLWPDSLRTKILQPAAKQAGISKRIGWHTFRHAYSSLLAHTGNDMRVVQELMRHAKPRAPRWRFTLRLNRDNRRYLWHGRHTLFPGCSQTLLTD